MGIQNRERYFEVPPVSKRCWYQFITGLPLYHAPATLPPPHQSKQSPTTSSASIILPIPLAFYNQWVITHTHTITRIHFRHRFQHVPALFFRNLEGQQIPRRLRYIFQVRLSSPKSRLERFLSSTIYIYIYTWTGMFMCLYSWLDKQPTLLHS